jgi:hypothetical protein
MDATRAKPLHRGGPSRPRSIESLRSDTIHSWGGRFASHIRMFMNVRLADGCSEGFRIYVTSGSLDGVARDRCTGDRLCRRTGFTSAGPRSLQRESRVRRSKPIRIAPRPEPLTAMFSRAPASPQGAWPSSRRSDELLRRLDARLMTPTVGPAELSQVRRPAMASLASLWRAHKTGMQR